MELTVAGQHVHAATGGRPFRPGERTAVFVHGAGVDHTTWNFQARHLAWRGLPVLAPDLPGHGRSAGRPPATVAGMAAWLEAMIRAAGAGAPVLIGHSMGSLIALEAAARLGPRAAGLVLLGTGTRMPVHPDLLAAAAAGENKAIDLILSWAFADRGNVGGHPAPGLWMKGGARRLFERGLASALGIDLKACDDYKDAERAAGRVACPAVVLSGAKDRMTPPKQGRDLAERISGAAHRTLAGVGHMPMIEDPVAVTAAIDDFLRTT